MGQKKITRREFFKTSLKRTLPFLGILTLAFLATGIFMIPFGVVVLFSQPAGGLMTAGTGLAFLGGGLLLLALSLLFYGRFVPALVRSAVDAADRLIHKRRPNV